jgi:hypothetical protein
MTIIRVNQVLIRRSWLLIAASRATTVFLAGFTRLDAILHASDISRTARSMSTLNAVVPAIPVLSHRARACSSSGHPSKGRFNF